MFFLHNLDDKCFNIVTTNLNVRERSVLKIHNTWRAYFFAKVYIIMYFSNQRSHLNMTLQIHVNLWLLDMNIRPENMNSSDESRVYFIHIWCKSHFCTVEIHIYCKINNRQCLIDIWIMYVKVFFCIVIIFWISDRSSVPSKPLLDLDNDILVYCR